MEIKDLIEITPEIKKEVFELLQACEKLKRLIQEQYKDAHFGISAASGRLSPDDLTIFDRHEYSKDGEGNDLGFFVHKFYSDGKYRLDFIPEESKEAQALREAINETQGAEDGKDE